MTLIQKLGLAYAAMFFAVVGLNYLPFIHDANGMMFGLFSLQWYDDLLHGFSGLWVLAAVFVSHRATVLFFKIFGSIYLFDGVLGLVTGSGCLDGGIFIDGFRSFDDVEFPTRFFANLPHLLIGGGAVYIGFVLSRRPAAASLRPA
ncbi:MAG: hypothetical protein Q8Q62_04050 [Mesorhizobium sp.]|nr:hypothetical protein [Mesorhizobium sp.]